MSHHFNPAYQQLVPLNQFQPQYGRFGNFMPYGQPFDRNVSVRRHQHTNSRPIQNSRKSNPKPFRQQQPQSQTKTPNVYSEIVKSSKAFCETDECSPAAKQIIALLTSLLEASSTNSQLHSTVSIDEHRRQHSIVIANLPERLSTNQSS
ncbi:hypothetical protein DdX_20418 [Ditylenchus destructor]|uniref:Uncharacterized protein n=1 Tax=Ditylenchus destructor TaxID=166010 RepID=A0AAD4MI39_9BILA|nr:hypothetical protein DdX_20418 [Ditylenchus destructor]